MRIGLFGGSFNPVHDGHISIAEHSISYLNLDELIFVPCFKSVDKKSEKYADIHHRINMLLIVLPKQCSISTYEISQKKEIESIDTIRYFRQIFPSPDVQLFFIIGEDNLETINTWKDYGEIEKLVQVVVFRRKTKGGSIISKYLKKIIVMDNEIWDTSSRNIRNRISTRGLNRKVEIYMRENNLYNYIG